MLAEVRHVRVNQVTCCLREQHLAAVARRGDARGAMDVHPDVLGRIEPRLARVDADAKADRAARQRCLHLADGIDSRRRVRERVEEGVSFVIDLVPRPAAERLADEPPVLAQLLEVALLTEIREQLRRARDVGEHERHRPGRLLGHRARRASCSRSRMRVFPRASSIRPRACASSNRCWSPIPLATRCCS